MAANLDPTHNQGDPFESRLRHDSQTLNTHSKNIAAEASTMIREKGWAFLRVSGSMFPWIRENDLVFVRKVSIGAMLRGEIAAFERNGAICIHRIVSLIKDSDSESTAIVTKGDGRTAEKDEPVCSSDFRGKVEFVYRGNREIPIASGWRRIFGKLLALISPLFGRYKPLAPDINTISACKEIEASLRFSIHRSTEGSAE